MHEDLFDFLLFNARQNGIDIVEVPGHPEDPDLAICQDNAIILNPNYKERIAPSFRLAHELSHILFGTVTEMYAFSPYLKKDEEIIANSNAVKMIAKFVYHDTPNEYRNWSDFMDEFNLPSWFEPLVKEIIYD
ncbi:hypothetical protein [Weissella viridescens]|uniref:hypothetical protein n=1 Tax=Weissella viridescens TaxID=1629 RepID=UPI0022DEFCD5|nr:hypothetical protein [Weissella viridescens]